MSDVILYHNLETPRDPALFTPFSIFHMLMGMFAFVTLRWLLPRFPVSYDFIIWFAIHSVYEVKDVIQVGSTNSLANSFGDTICGMLGFFLIFLYFGDRVIHFSDVLNFALIVFIFNFIIPEPSS